MDFFYNIHSMIKTVVHSRLDSSAGNKCEYKDDNDKLLSAIIKYNLKDLGDKKIISCYMIYDTAYFMDVESAASEINDPVIPDSYKRNIFFSAKTDSYFRKLGIFDEAVKRFTGKLRKMGIDDKLKEMGAVTGDNVRILDLEFDYEDF